MMKLPPLEYALDNVVLGWREEAVSFARENGYHLIVNSDQRPFHYFLGYQDIKSKWYEAIYDLGIRSLLPIPFDVQTIGLEDDKLKVITEGNTKVLIRFNNLHIFDLDNCGNLGVDEAIEDFLVHDMFDIVRGSRLGRHIIIKPEGEFIKTIEFVTSNRIDRDTSGDYKDIIVTSIIDYEDIKNFDYSDTVIRIFIDRTLKERNIKRARGRSLKIRHSFRHTVKNNFHFELVEELDKRIILHE